MKKQAAAKVQPRSQSRSTIALPWDERPHVQLTMAAEISGVSPATLYNLAGEGRLKLFKLAGRTLVDTGSLKELIASRQVWTPSDRGAAARAKRSEAARASLR